VLGSTGKYISLSPLRAEVTGPKKKAVSLKEQQEGKTGVSFVVYVYVDKCIETYIHMDM
jgi:hypothetical protein